MRKTGMNHKLLHWLAILLILATGILHFVTTAEEYSEARYMGVLFLANFFGSLVSALGIARRKLGWGWILGVVIAAGSIIGYIQSRTIGMPGMEVEAWYDPIGIPAVLIETAFLITFGIVKPWSADSSASVGEGMPAGQKHIAWTAASIALLTIGLVSVRLVVGDVSRQGEHPLPEAVISAQTLEDEYGIRVTLVAVTAAGGMVDVRYRIIDPEKAAKLIDPEHGGIMPMIHVEDVLCTEPGLRPRYENIFLVPDPHMRTQKLLPDRMYFTLIPNSRNAVTRGASVIVVFGDVALEPLVVR
jgi:hypothetical protein